MTTFQKVLTVLPDVQTSADCRVLKKVLTATALEVGGLSRGAAALAQKMLTDARRVLARRARLRVLGAEMIFKQGILGRRVPAVWADELIRIILGIFALEALLVENVAATGVEVRRRDKSKHILSPGGFRHGGGCDVSLSGCCH
eukprot:m.339275 g.339275  ORF g.339275 m.339275 type:complete len:144 (+) comp20580_c0_seq2:1098-1529(+)